MEYVADYRDQQLSNDKFGFGLFLAAVLHLVIILGVGFDIAMTDNSPPALDITLVNGPSGTVDDADFYAQQNQQGSGDLREKALVTSSAMSAEQGDSEQVADLSLENTSVGSEYLGHVLLSVDAANQPQQDALAEQGDSIEEREKTEKLNALRAQYDAIEQLRAKRPRLGTFTSVAAKAREDAAYQLSLQERILEVGNQYFQQTTVTEGLYGNLRMSLVIAADGSVLSVVIKKSSGIDQLDQAAMRIARLSSPFPAFPDNVAKKYDQIHFIRTWKFQPEGFSTGG